MNILLATSEAVPFAKTGGLADVCGALPVELARLGHQPYVFLPGYRLVHESGYDVVPMGITFEVSIGGKPVQGSISQGKIPGCDVPFYFIEQETYYDRDGLYGDADGDFKDNCERYVFFCRAVLQAIELLDLKIDLIHANDWQTGLLPALLKIEYSFLPRYADIATLLTIHNLAYQGMFWHWDMLLTGLDWKYFNWHQMECVGQLNLLKTGLVFSDSLNTVSPRYAKEIQLPQLGCGLEGILQHRREVLSGIINGVDYEQWNPANDPHLAQNYDVSNWRAGKAACKRALQAELGLQQREDVPLIGFVGRLAAQKGLELMLDVAERWVESHEAQWIFLGTGDGLVESKLRGLASRYPEKLAAVIEFSNPRAHEIEAAADLFVMPSRYEPCGLSQLYSLKYGTVPVVRATGGLADTVTNADSRTLADGTANGFSFDVFSAGALEDALSRACQAYKTPNVWQQLVETGMRQDWSWQRSAQQYIELYEATVTRRQQSITV